MLRLYRSSFHNVHGTFLHVNPTHPFTNDLESCTWTEQVTNCLQGFIASDSDRGRLNLQCSNAALWTWKGGTCLPGSATSSLPGVPYQLTTFI